MKQEQKAQGLKSRFRDQQILEYLRGRGETGVEELCAVFSISPATARRVVSRLVDTGSAERVWGGIRIPEGAGRDGNAEMLPSGLRDSLHPQEKEKIAQAAAALVGDGEVIIIDGGTTTVRMAPFLANRPVRILTNSILIAHRIDQYRTGVGGAEVFLTGGFLYPRSGLLVGPQAVENLRFYNARRAFLSAGGLDENGITNTNQLVVESELAMMASAQESIVLADHTKWLKKDMVRLCGWEGISRLITDRPPEKNYAPTTVAQ